MAEARGLEWGDGGLRVVLTAKYDERMLVQPLFVESRARSSVLVAHRFGIVSVIDWTCSLCTWENVHSTEPSTCSCLLRKRAWTAHLIVGFVSILRVLAPFVLAPPLILLGVMF